MKSCEKCKYIFACYMENNVKSNCRDDVMAKGGVLNQFHALPSG